MARAFTIPETPPPTTRADRFTWTGVRNRGLLNLALAADMRTRSFAFLVASIGSPWCTQAHWSRILAISNRYPFRPASLRVSMKRGSWVLGVQAATTTRFSPWRWISSLILPWLSWEQANSISSARTTFGRPSAYSLTSGTLTTPPMLMPQLQTNTPILGFLPSTSVSGG